MHAVSLAKALFQHKKLGTPLRPLSHHYATAIAGRLEEILQLPRLE
jgi:hypothetical protein